MWNPVSSEHRRSIKSHILRHLESAAVLYYVEYALKFVQNHTNENVVYLIHFIWIRRDLKDF